VTNNTRTRLSLDIHTCQAHAGDIHTHTHKAERCWTVMGTYLSTPVRDKHEESGESIRSPSVPLVWGVVDMQGWRKSMEDSHVAQTDVMVPRSSASPPHNTTLVDEDAKVFAVFDGHGGPEVARFCSLYLVSVLTQQPTWMRQKYTTSQGGDSSTTASSSSPIVPTVSAKDTNIGQSLVATFHALDRMIDDPNRRCVCVCVCMQNWCVCIVLRWIGVGLFAHLPMSPIHQILLCRVHTFLHIISIHNSTTCACVCQRRAHSFAGH
jgi:hypothetical protein